MKTHLVLPALGLWLSLILAPSLFAEDAAFTPAQLAERAIQRRAVEGSVAKIGVLYKPL